VVYTYSCYTKENIPKLKHRKWWNVFGRDEIVYEKKWVRVWAVTDSMYKVEAFDLLCKRDGGSQVVGDTLHEDGVTPPWGLQIEESPWPTSYISTNGTLTEKPDLQEGYRDGALIVEGDAVNLYPLHETERKRREILFREFKLPINYRIAPCEECGLLSKQPLLINGELTKVEPCDHTPCNYGGG